MNTISEVRLKNKVSVVTGGSSGIGAETVRLLAMHGAETIVLDIALGDVEPERFIHTDVSRPDEVNNAKDEVVKRYGRIDILINSAAVIGLSPIVEMTIEEWQRVIQVNLFGTFLCCRAFGRVMIEQRSGIIVNVASTRGIYGRKNGAHYAASKGGVIALTKSLAKELGPYGVRVHGINPGSTRTPFWASTHNEDERLQALNSGKVAEPGEIAGLIVLLTCPEARMIDFITIPRNP